MALPAHAASQAAMLIGQPLVVLLAPNALSMVDDSMLVLVC